MVEENHREGRVEGAPPPDHTLKGTETAGNLPHIIANLAKSIDSAITTRKDSKIFVEVEKSTVLRVIEDLRRAAKRTHRPRKEDPISQILANTKEITKQLANQKQYTQKT
jgi:hypothetical protein